MAYVDVICSSFLNSIIRPMIPCGMCPNSTPLLCFHSEKGLTIHLIVQSIRFSIILNLVWVTFGSIYLIFVLRTHALKQCRRFNGLCSEKKKSVEWTLGQDDTWKWVGMVSVLDIALEQITYNEHWSSSKLLICKLPLAVTLKRFLLDLWEISQIVHNLERDSCGIISNPLGSFEWKFGGF